MPLTMKDERTAPRSTHESHSVPCERIEHNLHSHGHVHAVREFVVICRIEAMMNDINHELRYSCSHALMNMPKITNNYFTAYLEAKRCVRHKITFCVCLFITNTTPSRQKTPAVINMGLPCCAYCVVFVSNELNSARVRVRVSVCVCV